MPPGVKLELELAQALPHVEADRQQIGKVLVNLVTNAVEALPGAGQVRIRTRVTPGDASTTPDASRVELEVADDGCGMDAECQRRAFDPFFSRKFPGRGLGLAVVQGIARAHAGRALIESLPGQGTTVTVELPAQLERVLVLQPDRGARESIGS